MSVDEAWKRIETWLAENAADVVPSLLPGASDDAIAELESTVGVNLPADFRDSLRRHEGQSDDAESGLFPYSDSVLGPAPAWRLLGLAEIEQRRSEMNELVRIGEFAGRNGKLSTGEQTDWWPADWLPIADDGGGDFACLDLSADPGRVVQFCHDSAKRAVFAPSFGDWLSQLARDLQAGRYHFDPEEWGLMEVDEDEP